MLRRQGAATLARRTEPTRCSAVISSVTMLEQRIQQQFFDSADLKYAAAEVLAYCSQVVLAVLDGKGNLDPAKLPEGVPTVGGGVAP